MQKNILNFSIVYILGNDYQDWMDWWFRDENLSDEDSNSEDHDYALTDLPSAGSGLSNTLNQAGDNGQDSSEKGAGQLKTIKEMTEGG